jgi:putative redox protein
VEVLIEHLGAVKFEIKARQHTIVSDQPTENLGRDDGMTPPELFLGALGSCAAFYVAAYLRRQNLAEEGTRVRVTADKQKDKHGARLDNFRIFVDVSLALEPKHVDGINREVHRCLIHNTLLHPPRLEIEVHSPAFASASS